MSEPFDETCSNNACGLTDIGRRRTENQDQFLIAELRKSMLVQSTSLPIDDDMPLFGSATGQLLIVADGMGGHAAGRRASSVAMDQLITQMLNRMHWFLHLDRDHEEEFIDSLKDLLRQAHARILSEAATDDSHRGMGTTLTLAYIVWPRMYVVHAGDSRCYLIRDGQCEQLTTDHTLARQLVESGGLKPEEEEQSRWSNVLWNVLGGSGEQELIAEVRRTDLSEGDMVLLCSDGLSRYLSTQTLAGVVSEGCSDHRSICHRLVGLANSAGGEDNITVVVCSPEPKPASEHAMCFRQRGLSALKFQRFDNCFDEDDETDLSHLLTEDGIMPEDFADEDTLPG
ncbi:PP2C family protein-serine/threonine phosphatase [Aporhodopirellula aestuarii]|uniref:Protein phosphatase 2C domain-containing protein n=1 Tax=Aporhodopirellula aestuarii TaxID=2950107 RepID=A0ABT0U8H6_9BACT|nr:protein phosphatase 2C domain-containing protein [Aporhodopirellula aestuarii]MCM2373279.1 protein phosphatase 2C domain-containing protein [Aporhodopirellula aestuarii]